MVDEEKTLLELVREKEIDLAAEYTRACAAADAAKETAAREARETVDRADQEGREAAEALYTQEMDGLDREIERIRTDARGQEDALRSTGESRVAKVADDLVGFVAAAPE
jgi:vacuolar-type H+-ATPase subunit H